MLSPFQIRNLRPSQSKATTQDSLVRISAPGYDKTISSHPAAKLRYQDDDDGDTVTVGSSTELAQRLEEPVPQKPRNRHQPSRNPMAIATLLSESQQFPPILTHHVFDVEDREEIRKLWQEIQENNNIPKLSTDTRRTISNWTKSEDDLIVELRAASLPWTEIQERLPGRSALSCALRWECCLGNPDTQDGDELNVFASAYDR